MYGKHFDSMYKGSMIGSGALVFAVMGYVIANQEPDREVGSQVELNPRLLAAILGEDEKDVGKAIAYLCEPDLESRSKEHEGRRLIRLGQFAYQVVNGAKYRAIRDEERRREQNRDASRRYRERKSGKKSKRVGLLPGEAMHERVAERGESKEELDRIVDNSGRDPY